MSIASALGMILTAGFLGVTHAIEPDHVAGITALTNEAKDPKLSAVVGACFAIGHALLVVVWILIAYLLLGITSFPPAAEQAGLVVVGLVLATLSGVLGVTGLRKLLHVHEHHHDSDTHAHVHMHIPVPGGNLLAPQYDQHGHDHTVGGYLKIGVVGALFTLSPPLSMIAFISLVLSNATELLVVTAVLAYTVAITLTMGVVGGGVGKLFTLMKSNGERVHAVSQIVAAALIFVLGIVLLWQNAIPLLAP